MARANVASALEGLSIAQLEELIASRRKSLVADLTAKRNSLLAELRTVDAELAKAGSAPSAVMGAPPAKRRGRPPGSKNKKRGPGRPPGSKNKSTLAAAASAGAAAPKGRPGRKPADGSGGGSMKDAIMSHMISANGADVAVADLIEKLKSRTTSSKPGTIVSLALMALKKDKLVESAGRGLYKLTAKGAKSAS